MLHCVGFCRRREERGSPTAWAYLLAVSADLFWSGIAERRRRRVRSTDRRLLSGLNHDLRFVLRRWRRDPGYAGIAVLLITLGVGVNAAAFGAVKAVLLSSPPLPDAGSLGLVRTRTVSPQGFAYGGWSYPELRELRDATRELFSGLAAYALRRGSIVEPGDPEHLGYELITPGYFATLGLRPAAGRFFVVDEEGVEEAPGVAVISHRMWLQRFGGNPAAVGDTLRLEGSRLTIVGVGPRGFDGLTGDARLWVPVGQSRPTPYWGIQRREIPWLNVIARLRAHDPAVAAGPLAAIGTAIAAAAPRAEDPGQTVATFSPIAELWIPEATRSALHLGLGAAVAVLLIVSVNLAALVLLAERRRARATAMRRALGADRWHILRGRLVESFLLTLGGGGLGLVVAHSEIVALARLWPAYAFRGSDGLLQLVDATDITIDGTIIAAGMALALLTTLLATAVPALLATRRDVVLALRGGVSPPGVRRHLQGWLVGAQIALATVLLSSFGLLAGTILSLQAQQRGFDGSGLLALSYSFVGRPAMGLAGGVARVSRAPARAAGGDPRRHLGVDDHVGTAGERADSLQAASSGPPTAASPRAKGRRPASTWSTIATSAHWEATSSEAGRSRRTRPARLSLSRSSAVWRPPPSSPAPIPSGGRSVSPSRAPLRRSSSP